MLPLIVLTFHLVLPAAVLLWLWHSRPIRRLDVLVRLLLATALLSDLFLAGRWDWIGYGWRLLLPLLLLAAATRAWLHARERPWWGGPSFPALLGTLVAGLLFAIFASGTVAAVNGQSAAEGPVSLSFPLSGGTYYVGQGGSTRAVNYHNVYPPQRYAMDLTKLNTLGTRARGLYPRELLRYEIFGAELLSPCEGRVLSAVDGFADRRPPLRNPDHPAGNHVVLACGTARVTLAHLMEESLRVRSGERVSRGQRIGRVGNSGNTTEPHLHIHAEDTSGKGLPITFGGRFLTRNSLFFSR